MITGIASISLTCVPTGTPSPRVFRRLESKARDVADRDTEEAWEALVSMSDADELDWIELTEALDGRIARTSLAGKPAGVVRRMPDPTVEGWRWSGGLHSSSLPLMVGDRETLKVSELDGDITWWADVHAVYTWRRAELVQEEA